MVLCGYLITTTTTTITLVPTPSQTSTRTPANNREPSKIPPLPIDTTDAATDSANGDVIAYNFFFCLFIINLIN